MRSKLVTDRPFVLAACLLLICVSCRAATSDATVTPAAPTTLAVTQNTVSVGRYDIYELTLENATHYDNPWEDPSITAVFTSPSGIKYTVGGFLYATNNQSNAWKVRFAPREVGAWTWSLSFANTMDKNPTFVTTGKFACVASTHRGFLHIHPCNNYRFMTEADGKVFYPVGDFFYCPPVPMASNKAADKAPVMERANWSTDGYAQPATIDDFVLTTTRAGHNMARWLTGGDTGLIGNDGFNVKGSGKNNYLLAEGVFMDRFMEAIHRVDWKCMMTFHGAPPDLIGAYTKIPGDPTITRAWLNYHQYLINRYGAYVHIWQLTNEQSDVPQAYLDTVISFIRANDPYRHLVSTSFYPYGYTDLDVASMHSYRPESNLDWVSAAAQETLRARGHINDSTGLLEPMLHGEWGEAWHIGAYSPVRHRLSLWIDFFNRGSIIFTSMGYKSAFSWQGEFSNEYIGSEERSFSKIFTDYIADFDPAAKPDAAVVLTPADQLKCYALSSPVDLGLYILHATSQNSVISGATVQVKVPANDMRGQWLDPDTGLFLGQPLALQTGRQTIPIPPFKNDLVLRLHAGGPAQTVQFNSSSYRVNADQASVTLTVNHLGGNGSAATVHYATCDGLAKAGTHYKATSGTLSWAAGDLSPKTITVPLINTGLLMADSDFLVTLTKPSGGAALGLAPSALVTLVNVVTNTASLEPLYVVANGAGKVVFTAKRLGQGVGPLTLYYSTHGSTAVKGVDYVGISLTRQNALVWQDGDLSPKTFSITILNNRASTGDKKFEVALDEFGEPPVAPYLNLGVPLVAGSTHPDCCRSTVVIQADATSSPGLVQFSGNDGFAPVGYQGFFGATYTVEAAKDWALIPVSRTHGRKGQITVEYATTQVGTAAAKVNFTPVKGTLSWADGDTADKIIKVPLFRNPAEVGKVTVWLMLDKPTHGAILGAVPSAMLNIVNPSPGSAP